ncbi:hypothetical protein C8K30_103291 [Promicromonospora sp. AC04]|uniref:hypothetical protein n=1 Tax=Promicromonospora sp. AC04 TaxID=2135723 RepID=UPI000D43CFC2|nr:hypothetical protein [Promicromonospora sp. AC04]PUB28866.1 hypothetical protein C8K30_103291 [Promicromonospora sp. AC04]
MSLHSTSRTSVFRRGLVALAAATTLLAGGLVAAPAAQALPIVGTDRGDGTTLTARLFASGDIIRGDPNIPLDLQDVAFGYSIDLDAKGGRLQSVEVQVTLRKVGSTFVRRFPVRVNSDREERDHVYLPGTISPGYYWAGIEVSADVQRADGQVNHHKIDVDKGSSLSFKRWSKVDGSIRPRDAVDGRPARITATVRVLRVADDQSLSWRTVRSGTVLISFDADGPFSEKVKPEFVRRVDIPSDGQISTVVQSRKGWWKVTYPGTDRYAAYPEWIGQGVPEGCSC